MKKITNAHLRTVAEHFKEKLSQIKVCAFDVDGILTNGLVFYQDDLIGFNRFTNVNDGYGLKVLQQAGLKVGIISGGNSVSVVKRFEENLKLDFCYIGNEDKRMAYQKILDEGYQDHEILYIADEFFDLPLLVRAGFSATVPSASLEIQEAVDYVTEREGGQGAAREVIDLLRYAQNIIPQVPQFD